MVEDTARRVLTEYLKDSRQSYREVAKRIGVSSGTVASRVREMEEGGIIKRYTALLDYEKLGYELTVVTEIVVSGGRMLEAGEEIARMGPTCAVYNVTGDSDIMVVGKFKTRRELSDFTKKILRIPHVERTKTHLVLNTIKEDFSLLP